MAPVSSEVQSESSADTPEPGDPREGGSPADPEPELEVEIDDGQYGDEAWGGAVRRRARAGWERGREWMRPNREPRPEPRGTVRERLVPPFYPESFRGAGWILPLLVTAVGGFMRFWKLGTPNKIIFDETYYAKDAWSMTVYGWEHAWQTSSAADPALVPPNGSAFGHNGKTLFGQGPEYVVHPPVGKWVIGAGERIWGLNPVGWRLMEAVLGTIAIYILARTARRMFRSTLLGCVAGLLMAFDGLSFVMARTALLDGIQMFFILCGFSCLLVDRDKTRAKFADWREAHGTTLLGQRDFGPKLGLRPWRLLAGLSLGLATATKWNGVYFLAAFAVLTVFWDRGARRAVGLRLPSVSTLVRDVPWAFLSVPVLGGATFVGSYAGWFINRTPTSYGYNRYWAVSHPSNFWPIWTNPFRSLWNYVDQQYQFNVGLESGHPYMSTPWSWFIMGRPVAFDYQAPKVGTQGCTPQMGTCSQEVLALGTPLLWWFGSAAILFLFWRWIGRRDWRAGAILCGLAAGVLPWMHYAERTIFSFYAISFAPYIILSATMGIGAILGRADASPNRRAWGAAVAGTLVIGIVGMFIYFYPIYTDQTISYTDWANHMWLPSWI
jgi:dolichyl-phosphate-mannose-protein mannosyltransferase